MPHETPRDLTYELNLLHRIERVSVDGVALSEYPFFERYSYWHRFVQYVFSSDILRFSRYRNFKRYIATDGKRTLIGKIKAYSVSSFGILVSVCAVGFAVLSKPRVLLFGIDRISSKKFRADFRIAPLYAFLEKNHIPHLELFRAVFNASFLKNFFSRARLGFYLDSVDLLCAFLRDFGVLTKPRAPVISGLDIFNSEERAFVSHIVSKYLAERETARIRARFLTWFLKAAQFQAVWGIDDSRYYHDVAYAAKQSKIPMYVFQHGHFTPYHVGWLKEPRTALSYLRPDYLVVWSEYWKKELLRLGSVFSSDEILVSGYEKPATSFPEGTTDSRSILIPHETDSPKEEVVARITNILELFPAVAVIIKLRPDHERKAQTEGYGALAVHPRVTFITQLSELKTKPSAVLGVYSSFLYDMVRAGLPVGIFETSMDYGKGMIENDLAELIPPGENAGVVLQRLFDTPTSVLASRAAQIDSKENLEITLTEIAESCGILPSKKVG